MTGTNDTLIHELVNPDYGYYYSRGKTLHQEQTKYQLLEIIETETFGKTMLLDGITQVGVEKEWQYHEPMVHTSLITHPSGSDVAIIGAGDGGILREVLKHDPATATMCDLDGEVIEACKKHLLEINAGAFDDPRANVIVGDGRAFIAQQTAAYDAVIMDMTDPFGPSAMLYTQEYFQAVKNSLKNSASTYTMHCESPVSRPRCFQQILHTLGTVWKHQVVFYTYIQMYGVLWAMVVNSDEDIVSTISSDEIDRRLSDRAISGLHLYDGASHHAMRVDYPWIRQLIAEAPQLPIVTDAAHVFQDEIDLNS